MVRSFLILWFVNASAIFCEAAVNSAPFQTVLDRYRSILLDEPAPDAEAVSKFMQALAADGTWPDIHYDGRTKAGWEPLDHLKRINGMARAFAHNSHALHQHPELLTTIFRALDHWFDKKYHSQNWWYGEIGVPREMRDIAVLLDDELQGHRRQAAWQIIAQHRLKGTAANLAWSAELALHYACLTEDESLLNEAARRLWKELKTDSREGIQSDGSFLQHQARLQSFGYGKEFVDIMAKLAWQLRDTSCSMPPEKQELFNRYLLDGLQWMCRGTNTVPGTVDRAFSRKDRLAAADIRSCLRYWRDIHPTRVAEIDAFLAHQASTGSPLVGFRHFPRGDFTAYHRPAGSIFLKTISARTMPTEAIIGENLLGVPFLNSGDHYVLRDGQEYEGLQPVLQWQHLPGITTANPASRQSRTQFVGGLGDGSSGLTAMQYVRTVDERIEIDVRKAWFFYGDQMVCLLGGWKTPSSPAEPAMPITTALEQCRLRQPVEADQGDTIAPLHDGEHLLDNPRWILHRDIGYLPLGDSKLSVYTGPAEGTWATVNKRYYRETTPVTVPVLRILMQHPAVPTSTGYAIVLDANRKKLSKLADQPTWKILRNDRNCQAVAWENKLTMAAFYQADKVAIPNSSDAGLQTDQPCLAQWTDQDLWICNPLHEGKTVNLNWNGQQRRIKLPADGTGQSISRVHVSNE